MSKNKSDVVWQYAAVTRQRRAKQNDHKSVVLWFTGLPCSGKSTLANALEEQLHQMGCRTFVLDGDNVRHGLCSDLKFTKEARVENIRRVGEVAKLLLEAGVITLTAFISPFRTDREKVRGLLPHGEFMEIFCDASLEVCERRDVKGMYRRARKGEIEHFTGVSSPYEIPVNPELIIDTGQKPLDECVNTVLEFLVKRGIIKHANGGKFGIESNPD